MAEDGDGGEVSGRKPWEHMAGEDFGWFDLFSRFRLLGPRRTLIRVYQDQQRRDGKAPGASLPGGWRAVVNRFQWWERARAWDAQKERLVTPELESRANQDRIEALSELLDGAIDPASDAGQLRALEGRVAELETGHRLLVERLDEMETKRGGRFPGLE